MIATPLRSETLRALRKLAQDPQAFIFAPHKGAPSGVFGAQNAYARPLAQLSAQDMRQLEVMDWLELIEKGELGRKFRLSTPGARGLTRLKGAPDDAQEAHQAQHRAFELRQIDGEQDEAEKKPLKKRVNIAESPLTWLAKRKDAAGRPLLTPEHLAAGERLRSDFEQAQLGPRVAQDWRRFLAVVDEGGRGPQGPLGPEGARARLNRALEALGADLADVALRVCCCAEGLESVEKAFGWSQRSGKVVLRIALERLVTHYGLKAIGASKCSVTSWRSF